MDTIYLLIGIALGAIVIGIAVMFVLSLVAGLWNCGRSVKHGDFWERGDSGDWRDSA